MRAPDLAAVILYLLIGLEGRLRSEARGTKARDHSSRTDTNRDGYVSGGVKHAWVPGHRICNVILELQIAEANAVSELPGVEVEPHPVRGCVVPISKGLVGATKCAHIAVHVVGEAIEEVHV